MSYDENINRDRTAPDSPSTRNSKDAFFEPKPKPKMIRVLTVLAYVLSVSMAAILLSIYYIFMWDGRPHIGARRSDDMGIAEFVGESYSADMPRSSAIKYQGLPTSRRQKLVNTAQQHAMASTTEGNFIVNITEETILTENIVSTSTEGGNQSFISEINSTVTEMQQQFTEVEPEELDISSTPSSTTEENITWPDDFESFDELRTSSSFVKKLMSDFEENY